MDQIEAANASLDGSWSPDCEREGRAVDAADAEQVQDAFDLLMGCFSLPAEEGEPAARGHAPARRGLEHQASSSSLLSFSDRDNHIGLEQTGESRTWDKHSSRSICTETEREAERLAALARVQLDRLGDDGQVGSWGDAAKALRRLLDTKAPRGPEQLAELRETARIFAREALSKKIFSFRYKQRNHEGRAVHIAAIHRDGHSLMAELLDLGVDPTTACTFSAFDNPCSATALHLAAGCGHTEVLRQLLQASVDVNARSTSKGRENYTALHEASFFQQTSAVEFLLRASAQPDARNISLRTPLHVAAQQGSPAVAQALLGKDPSLVCEEDHQRDTPLMVAIEHGRFPAVKLHMLCERTIEDVLRVAQVSPAAAAVLMRAGTDVDEVHHVWRKVLRGRVTVAQWVELMERAPAAAEDVLEALTQAPRVNGRSSNLVPRQAVFRNMEPLRCEYQPETTWSEEVKRWHLTLAPQDIRAWWGRPSAEQKQKGQAVHPERASALPSEEQGPQGPLPVGQRPKRSSSNVSLLRSLTMLADNLRGQPKMVPVRVKVVRLPGIMSYQVLHALATTSHLHVFSKLPVRAIVEHAWRSTVRMSYMYSIFLRVITLCILIISVMPPDFAESEIYRRAAWSYLCAHALEELQYELCEMYGMLFVLVPAASGRSSDYCVDMLLHVLRFFWRAYLTNYKNMFDASSIGLLLVLLAISMDSLRLDTWPSVLALVSAARWFQFMYTLRAFKMWGYRLLPLIHSLVPLSGILCITVFFFLGCLQAFLVLDSGTRSFSDIFVAMFRFLFLGDLDDQDTALEILRAYGTGFTLVFFAICIFFNIFILNLFITTTGEAYDKAQELCMTSFQQERANICLNYMLRPSVECMRKAWKERWHLWLMTTVGLLLLLPLWYALVLAPGVPVLIPAIVLLAFNVLFDAIVVRHPWQNCLDGCKDNRIWICHRADYCETDYWPSERSGPRVTSGRTASLKQDNMQRTNRHMSELSSLRHRQCKLQSLVEHDVAERLSGMELRLDQLLGMLKPESALAGTMDEGSLRRELPRKGTAIGSLGFSAPGSPLGASEGSPLRLARESSRPRLGGKPDHEIAAEEPPGAGGPRAAPAQEPPQQQCGPRRPALQQPRRPQHRLPPVLPPQLPAPPPEPPADVGAAHRGRERVN